MKWMRWIFYKVQGAFHKAPFAISVIVVVSILGIIGLILGIREEKKQSENRFPQPPVKVELPKEQKEQRDTVSLIYKDMPPIVFSPFTEEEKVKFPKPITDISGRLFWLLNTNARKYGVTKDDVLKEIEKLCDDGLYDWIAQDYDLTYEPPNWKAIYVLPIEQLNTDVWKVGVLGITDLKPETANGHLIIIVRKVEGKWIVCDIRESADGS